MSSEKFKCTKCDVFTRKMDNFYICPECMNDYATTMEMNMIQDLFHKHDQRRDLVLQAVQNMIDKDREKLRLMLIHEEQFQRALAMLDEKFISDPRMADYDKNGVPYWEADHEE